MGFLIFSHLQNFWPFYTKFNDLKASDQLVRKLSVPDHTKQFVFAVRDPDSGAVIYILAAQNLSERSAVDAEYLIREVRPDAVVAQVGHTSVAEILLEDNELGDFDGAVPTSLLGVLGRAFVDKINREKYESVAGNLVLREIFGISFHGHFFAAKRAAHDVGSAFMLLESPLLKSAGDNPSEEPEMGNKFQALGFQLNSLVPQNGGTFASLVSRRFLLTNDIESRMVKSLSPHMESSALNLTSSSVTKVESGALQPLCDYKAPPFAQSVYPLLVDLHNIFADLPSMEKALTHAQKIFYDVSRGQKVDSAQLCELYTFRIAVEGLRIALNSAGRLPINKRGNHNSAETEFSELSVEEKSHALLAEALRAQTQKFKTMVAIVDASGLAGLRKNWNTPIPPEVKDLVGQLVADCESDGQISQGRDRKQLLTTKSVVAVGAGATAAIGVSSLSKFVPASTIMKMVTFKAPASLKLFLTHTHRVIGIALSNSVGPTKIMVAPGVVSSGAKTSIALKAAASAEKIRVVAHSIIASAEKTSLSAMRTAFYEIMRKRGVARVGFLPWAAFGCSFATCAGLFAYGDGIECAAESVPSAPSIASLGRGIQSLQQASEVVRQTHGSKIQKSIESLMQRLKKAKIQ